jgi:hypothetical protein
MIDIAEWAGFALLTGFAITIAWIVGRALWGAPEDGGSEWESALTPLPALPPSPVEVIFAPAARIVRAVEHVGATELAPALGAIGTLALRASNDLLTFAEQVAGDADEWAGFTQALVDSGARLDAARVNAAAHRPLAERGWPGSRACAQRGAPGRQRDVGFTLA